MSYQLSHVEKRFTKKQFPITVICDHLDSPANQGALFRVSESFGVKEIIFFGNAIDVRSSRLKRTARSTEKLIPYSCITDVTEIITTLKKSNTHLIGLEITADSKSLEQLSLINNSNIVLVIGSEKYGISEILLDKIDSVYHIPMYGSNSSMNVIQAASIALYALTTKLSS